MTHRVFVAVSALCLILNFLFSHLQSPVRKISPLDLHTHFGKTYLEPLEINANDSPLQVQIMIAPDLAVGFRHLSFTETINWSLDNDAEQQRQQQKKVPFAFATELGLDIKAPVDRAKCAVKAILNDRESGLVTCEEIRKRGKAFFRFEGLDFIPVGRHVVKLYSDSALILNGFRSADDVWAEVFSGARMDGIDILKAAWISCNDLQIAYFTLSLVTLASVSLAAWRKKNSILIVVFVHALLALLITPYFSGFDETAHVSNFYEAARVTATQSTSPIVDEKTYNRLASKTMFESAFYRLNQVYPIDPEICPHQILGSCGTSESPQALYKYYAASLKALGYDFRQLTPEVAIWVGRIANFLLFTGTVLISIFLLPISVRRPFVISIVLAGCLFSQIGTLTNDIPMYCLGILGVVAFTRLTSEPVIMIKDPLAVACFLLAFAWLRRIDASFHAAIPTLAVVLVLFLLKISSILFGHAGHRAISRSRAVTLTLIILAISIALPFVFHQILQHSKNSNWLESLSRHLPINPEAIIKLQGFASFDLEAIVLTFIEHFRTITGTYVWGHSFIPWSMSLAVAMIWTGGWIRLFHESTKPFHKIDWMNLMPSIRLITLLVILTAHLLIVCSIMDPKIATEFRHRGEFLALAQARLSAPGSIFVFMYPIMNLCAFSFKRRGHEFAENLVTVYVFALLIKVYPALLIINAY